MPKKLNIRYNPLFIFPFLAWVIIGGILLLIFSRDDLFFAVNRHYSDFADGLMSWVTVMGRGEFIILALALLMVTVPRFRNLYFFFLAVSCNVIPLLFQQVLKSVFNFPRPLLYYQYTHWVHFSSDWPLLLERSFPSGHSEGAFSFFSFLSLLLPLNYRKYGLLFFLLALSVCYSRIYLAAHFFDDVYLGSIIGGLFTTVIFSVMENYKERFFQHKGSST